MPFCILGLPVFRNIVHIPGVASSSIHNWLTLHFDQRKSQYRYRLFEGQIYKVKNAYGFRLGAGFNAQSLPLGHRYWALLDYLCGVRHTNLDIGTYGDHSYVLVLVSRRITKGIFQLSLSLLSQTQRL